MSNDLEKRAGIAEETATEIGPGTIYTCWNEYSAKVEASDKTEETLERLWGEYIAELKKTPRTISGCMKEYYAAIEALGSAAAAPDVKSGLWKTYSALVKGCPQTPENLADDGWTVPKRGDSLGFENPNRSAANLMDSRGRGALRQLSVAALPNSLTIFNPDFVTPILTRNQVEAATDSGTQIKLPALWAEGCLRDVNVLRVRVNDRFPSDIPLDIASENEGAAGKIQAAVREGLNIALAQIKFLEERHEKGTADPGPYRLSFKLANVEKEDSTARFAEKPGVPGFKGEGD